MITIVDEGSRWLLFGEHSPMSSPAVPQDIRNRSVAGIASPKSSMLGQVLAEHFLK
jgi:hypothetical protein